jgi:beta-fructofuranosidase
MNDQEAYATRLRLAGDPHRPLFHFLPPNNWMNDPNGLIQLGSHYHLFYQHNPYSPTWGEMHWGHAVSSDLLHWEDHPIALSPTPGGLDQTGCWSGCAVNFHQIPTLIYTARNGETETVCLATSQDELMTVQKHPRNPAYILPPEGKALSGFRDPFVWKNGLGWSMIIGSGYPGKGGVIFLYKSQDLMRWELKGSLLEWDDLELGDMWECPSLISFGTTYLLIISVMAQGKAVYFMGDFIRDKFIPKKRGILDAGGAYYAPLAFTDEKDRAIIFGWSWERRSVNTQFASGWAGVQALPRQLTLAANGDLRIEPIEEVESIRKEFIEMGRVSVAANQEVVLPISGNCLEISLSIEAPCNKFGIKVLCSPDQSEFTEIGFDPINASIYIDTTKSSQSTETFKERFESLIDLLDEETLMVRIFIDRSILEVFINNRWCMTSRIYPVKKDSQQIVLFSTMEGTLFEDVVGWTIERIWPG